MWAKDRAEGAGTKRIAHGLDRLASRRRPFAAPMRGGNLDSSRARGTGSATDEVRDFVARSAGKHAALSGSRRKCLSRRYSRHVDLAATVIMSAPQAFRTDIHS